jgi:hypothetical protein
MPAVSKAQQRFMGMVHAVQNGDMKSPSKEVEKVADDMKKKDAKDYASTKHTGLPNKKENMNTTITKERLKELVKEVMTEENEYQAFFAKALEKAGKSIPSMSDAEKKAFFDKIDSAWSGKGEKKVDEASVTGGVAGYNTPAAFSASPEQNRKKNKRLAATTGYDVVKDENKK